VTDEIHSPRPQPQSKAKAQRQNSPEYVHG
jgi:hypothetical protein